jgi:hypothetical protein
VYEGDWEAGSKHGIGRWMSIEKDQDAIVYAGSYENGNAEGHGSLSWPTPRPPKAPKTDADGAEAAEEEEEHELPPTTYVGEFKGGVRHGKGRFVQPVKVLVSQVAEGRDATPAGSEIEGETAERKAKKQELMAALVRGVVVKCCLVRWMVDWQAVLECWWKSPCVDAPRKGPRELDVEGKEPGGEICSALSRFSRLGAACGRRRSRRRRRRQTRRRARQSGGERRGSKRSR